MTKKQILIVTYYWPPSGGVGVQRWLHFAKNLKSMGWEPVVYTPENPQFDIRDTALENLAKDIEVIRKPIWEPFTFFHQLTGNTNKENIKQGLVLEKTTKTWKDDLIVWIRGNVFVPDPRVFWVRPSVKFLKRVMKKRGIKTLITTGPPHSMHLVGLGLKKRMPDLKWLADFRDPWSDWDVLPKLKVADITLNRHKRLERKVLERSDGVITVSHRLAQALSDKTNPKIGVRVITNGISDEKAKVKQQATPDPDEKFVIGYYGMLNELRNPEAFWEVLEELCEQNPEFDQKLEIRLGGIVAQYIRDRLESSSRLQQKVVFLGYLSHESVFKEYGRCNVLLLLLNQTNNARWILPMKFFEYLSAGRPVLSLGPETSDLGELFEGKAIGRMLEFGDTDGIRNFIQLNFQQKYEQNMGDYIGLLKTFSRSHQTRELAKVLDSL